MPTICSRIAKSLLTLCAAAVLFIADGTAMACTGITFSAPMEGAGSALRTFAGRTMEFGPDVAYWKLMYVPQGFVYDSCRLTSLDSSVLDTCIREIDNNPEKTESVKGYNWPVKYGYVGFTPMRLVKKPRSEGEKFEYNLTEINDGINSQGLYCGGLYHMGFETYSNMPSNLLGQNNISNMDFVGWVLGQFSTVEEVEKGLNNVVVRMFDVSLLKKPFKDPTKMPHLHYHVVDKSGKAIVIEFVNGKAKVFPSVGAITNNPTYDWQVMNLRNYVGLQTKNFTGTSFMGSPYTMLSNGTGGIGLPGDFTSTSRFIRAMYFLNATVTNNTIRTSDEAIARSFKILNQFDIPEGSVVETSPTDPAVITTKEATSWTSMADLSNLRYYYHTMLNRTVRMVDLNELLKIPATRPVMIELPQNELIVDETGSFTLLRSGK